MTSLKWWRMDDFYVDVVIVVGLLPAKVINNIPTAN
jgi:hypothetical protein